MEKAIQEDWKQWAAPAALAAASLGGYAARATGHGGDPSWLQDRPAQVQQSQTSGPSTTVELPAAKPQGAEVNDAVYHQASQALSKAQEAKLLALTMWGEARNSGAAGMRAVGHVILNRAQSGLEQRFGEGIKGVVWHHKQFSCWNKGDPNRAAMQQIAQLPKGDPDRKAWEEAQKLASKILSGHDRDPTDGALFYHTSDTDPSWNNSMQATRTIGGHEFYKGDSEVLGAIKRAGIS